MCPIYNTLQASVLYHFLNQFFLLIQRKILSGLKDINGLKVPIIGYNILKGLDLPVIDKRAESCGFVNGITFLYNTYIAQTFEPSIELLFANIAFIAHRRTLQAKICHLNYI